MCSAIPALPVDRRRGFFEMGMDSLMVVELRRRLEADLQRPLPTTVAFNYPTVEALGSFLAQELLDPGDHETPTPALTNGIASGTVDDLEEPSEDELLQQLTAKLGQCADDAITGRTDVLQKAPGMTIGSEHDNRRQVLKQALRESMSCAAGSLRRRPRPASRSPSSVLVAATQGGCPGRPTIGSSCAME